jgi:hypothetical protein
VPDPGDQHGQGGPAQCAAQTDPPAAPSQGFGGIDLEDVVGARRGRGRYRLVEDRPHLLRRLGDDPARVLAIRRGRGLLRD